MGNTDSRTAKQGSSTSDSNSNNSSSSPSGVKDRRSSGGQSKPLKFSKEQRSFGTVENLPSSGRLLLLQAIGGGNSPTNNASLSGNTGGVSRSNHDDEIVFRHTTNASNINTQQQQHQPSKEKSAEEIVKAKLEALRLQPGNETCADCMAPSSTWASVNVGVFLCIKCVGCHRALGTHVSVTKSTTLDAKSWSDDMIRHMEHVSEEGGNAFVNARLEYYVPPEFRKPVNGITSAAERQAYIRAKYQDKLFIKIASGSTEPLPPRPDSPNNQQTMDNNNNNGNDELNNISPSSSPASNSSSSSSGRRLMRSLRRTRTTSSSSSTAATPIGHTASTPHTTTTSLNNSDRSGGGGTDTDRIDSIIQEGRIESIGQGGSTSARWAFPLRSQLLQRTRPSSSSGTTDDVSNTTKLTSPIAHTSVKQPATATEKKTTRDDTSQTKHHQHHHHHRHHHIVCMHQLLGKLHGNDRPHSQLSKHHSSHSQNSNNSKHGHHLRLRKNGHESMPIKGSFSLAKQEFVGMVEIYLISASELDARDTLRNTSDPYVVFELGQRRAQSSYKRNTLNPVWNEGPDTNIALRIPWDGKVCLMVSCWDHESLLRDNLIGRAMVDISALLTLDGQDGVTAANGNDNNENGAGSWIEAEVLVYHHKADVGDMPVPLRVLKQAKDTLRAIGTNIKEQFGSSTHGSSNSSDVTPSPPRTPTPILSVSSLSSSQQQQPHQTSGANPNSASKQIRRFSSTDGSPKNSNNMHRLKANAMNNVRRRRSISVTSPSNIAAVAPRAVSSSSSPSSSSLSSVRLAGKLQLKLRFIDLR